MRVTAASLLAIIRKNQILLQVTLYAALIAGSTYALATGIGFVGSSLQHLVPEAPSVQPQLRRANVPLPPVILPPAGPTPDPAFARRTRPESSFVTLGAPPPEVDIVPGAPDVSESIVTLASPAPAAGPGQLAAPALSDEGLGSDLARTVRVAPLVVPPSLGSDMSAADQAGEP